MGTEDKALVLQGGGFDKVVFFEGAAYDFVLFSEDVHEGNWFFEAKGSIRDYKRGIENFNVKFVNID